MIILWFCISPLKAQNDLCLEFDGGDYLTASSTIFDQIGTSDFTIEFWINGDAPVESVEPILSNRETHSNFPIDLQGFMIFFHPLITGSNFKLLSIRFNQTNWTITNNGSFNGDIQDGLCHHIAIVRKGQNSLIFYIDGFEIGGITDSKINFDISSSRTTYIGYDITDKAGFNGLISDLRVWTEPRSEAQINQNKDTYLTGYESGLIANWQLNDINFLGEDSSPNNFDANLNSNVNTHPNYSDQCCSITSNGTCLVNTINISTGVDHVNTQLYPVGQQINYWTLIDIPPPSVAPTANINLPYNPFTIQPNPAWGNFPNSSWISAFNTNELDENNRQPLPPYSYETCFCVADDNSDVLFDFQFLADDIVTVLLTDTQGNTLQNFGTAKFKQSEVKDVNTSFNLDEGTYCIRGDVRNTNRHAMGFNLEGTISGASFIDYGCCIGDGSTITGQKYHDKNCDGAYSSDEIAMGLAGWQIQLIDPNTGQTIETQSTDDLGFYYFRNLPAGNYAISEVHQANWEQTLPGNNYYQVDLGNYDVQGGFHFGNKYEGPIETEGVDVTCVGQNERVKLNWIGQECDCDIEIIAMSCQDAGPDVLLATVENTGSFSVPAGTLIGEYSIFIRDCDGNEIPFAGCVTFNDYEVSINIQQVACGEYDLSFLTDGFELLDIQSVNWTFDAEGTSTNNTEIISFETAGTYNISLTMTLSSGCVVTDYLQLIVEQGVDDPDCNFCPPNVLSEIEQGDLFIYDECYGMIIKSPNGSCFRVKVNDEGMLYAQGIECP